MECLVRLLQQRVGFDHWEAGQTKVWEMQLVNICHRSIFFIIGGIERWDGRSTAEAEAAEDITISDQCSSCPLNEISSFIYGLNSGADRSHLSLSVSACLSVYLLLRLPVSLHVCVSVSAFIGLHMHVGLCRSMWVCVQVCPFVYPCIFISVSVWVCVHVYVSVLACMCMCVCFCAVCIHYYASKLPESVSFIALLAVRVLPCSLCSCVFTSVCTCACPVVFESYAGLRTCMCAPNLMLCVCKCARIVVCVQCTCRPYVWRCLCVHEGV